MLVPKRFYGLRSFSNLVARDLFKLLLLYPAALGVEKSEPTTVSREYKHLVILRPDLVGDFVVFARDFHRFRALYPADEWTVTLIGNKNWRSLAEEWNRHFGNRWFDRFIEIDRKSFAKKFRYRRELAKRLKGLGCDELIYPVSSRDVWGNVMAKWIPAFRKVAPYGDTDNIIAPFKWWFDRCFTKLIREGQNIKLETDRTNHFLKALGSTNPKHQKLSLLPVTQLMKKERKIYIESIGLKSNERYVVIFPGASLEYKRWPAERFIEWGIRQTEKNLYVIVCGGPLESELGKKVVKGIGAGAFNLTGQTSLVGLSGIIAGAELCFSNDTAAVHISAAFNRPSICILGGGHWGRFWPYGNLDKNQTLSHYMSCFGCGWKCRYVGTPSPCIKLIKFN